MRYELFLAALLTTTKLPRTASKSKIHPGAQRVADGTLHILPGESAAEDQLGLDATIAELAASTPLQVYLAEKMFECLWWVRGYETQKRDIIVGLMAIRLRPSGAKDDASGDAFVTG